LACVRLSSDVDFVKILYEKDWFFFFVVQALIGRVNSQQAGLHAREIELSEVERNRSGLEAELKAARLGLRETHLKVMSLNNDIILGSLNDLVESTGSRNLILTTDQETSGLHMFVDSTYI